MAFILAARNYRRSQNCTRAIEVDLQFCTLSSMARRWEHRWRRETRVTCFFRLIWKKFTCLLMLLVSFSSFFFFLNQLFRQINRLCNVIRSRAYGEITFVKKLYWYECANPGNEKEVANINSADACRKTIEVKKYYYLCKNYLYTFIKIQSI